MIVNMPTTRLGLISVTRHLIKTTIVSQTEKLMGSIRTHTKSRLGCVECKARRVKCDESHPMCRNCERRGQKCSYTNKIVNSLDLQVAIKYPHRNILELELLHHYSTNTCLTLLHKPAMLDKFQLDAPRLAFKHPSLLNAMFCITTLHLSILRTDEYYDAVSEQYYQEALNALTDDDLDTDCIFLFNIYICAYVCRRSATRSSFSSMISAFNQIREAISALHSTWGIFVKGESAPWRTLRAFLTPLTFIPSFAILPESIGLLCHPSPFAPDPDEVKDPSVAETYKQAIDVLRIMHSFLPFTSDHQLAIALFYTSVTDAFVEKLNEAKPRALVILAYQSAILMLIDANYWWIQTKGNHDITLIAEGLEPEWREWIEWPLEIQRLAGECARSPQLLITV